jgi:hypothetical protein
MAVATSSRLGARLGAAGCLPTMLKLHPAQLLDYQMYGMHLMMQHAVC